MTIKSILMFSLCLVLSSCTSYDKLYLYGPLYSPPLKTPIHYNGYYFYSAETIPSRKSYFDVECPNNVSPIFFYRDGTVFTCGSFCDHDSLRVWVYNNRFFVDWQWGTFDYKNDTLIIEGYTLQSGRYFNRYRFYQKGVFSNDGDTLFIKKYIDNDWNVSDKNWVYVFRQLNMRPDSSQSFLKSGSRFKDAHPY